MAICHTSPAVLAAIVPSENTAAASASDQRRPTRSPSQPPDHEPRPKPTIDALMATPKMPRSTPNSAITSGATIPSSCWSRPSATSTIIQIMKVSTWNVRSGRRDITSLKLTDIGTPCCCYCGWDELREDDSSECGYRAAGIAECG